MSTAPPRLLAISPPVADRWIEQLDLLVECGVHALVLRLVEGPGDLLTILERAPLPSGLSVLVRPSRGEDVALAMRHGLGLHLPATWDPDQHRDTFGGLLSTACHHLVELERAQAAACDFALYSPVFPPGSKPQDTRRTLGLDGLRAGADAVAMPVLALGGVGPAQIAACLAAGAWGVAGIGAFFRGGEVDPASARAMSQALAEALATESAAP